MVLLHCTVIAAVLPPNITSYVSRHVHIPRVVHVTQLLMNGIFPYVRVIMS